MILHYACQEDSMGNKKTAMLRPLLIKCKQKPIQNTLHCLLMDTKRNHANSTLNMIFDQVFQ